MIRLLTSTALISVVLGAGVASADSFAINEYTSSDLGRANSGRVVQTEDPAAAFGNPALMTDFDGKAVSVGVSAILGDATYTDLGSTDAIGQPLGGDTSGIIEDAYVPYAHGVFPIAERWWLGISVTAPFGLATAYEDDWSGRYQAIDSDLKTININPSLAYKLNDQFSFGGGVSIQYVEAELSSAIDFGTVCFSQVGPAQCSALGVLPQTADGRSTIEGEDWSIGWNLGMTYTPNDAWKFGFHYRSGVDHKLTGDADFEVPAQAQFLTATGAFMDTPAKAYLDLPAAWEIGASWKVTPKATIYADAIWMEWSSLEELRVQFTNNAQPDSVEPLRYEDAGRYSIGADYDLTDSWTIRAGFAYDETPVQPDHRSARIPDHDRQIYAVGTSWTPVENWTFDLAYNRIEIGETTFDATGRFNDRVYGDYTGEADLIAISATKRF